jgi:hypothetical protein
LIRISIFSIVSVSAAANPRTPAINTHTAEARGTSTPDLTSSAAASAGLSAGPAEELAVTVTARPAVPAAWSDPD